MKTSTPCLLFSYQSGLKHNRLYSDIQEVYDELIVICEEEEVDLSEIPNFLDILQHLQENDDFELHLSNGTWIHIQPTSLELVVC